MMILELGGSYLYSKIEMTFLQFSILNLVQIDKCMLFTTIESATKVLVKL